MSTDRNFQILDCTLRDGGYYTNWDFDERFVTRYLNAMRAINVDMIEIGYRSPEKPGYFGRYFHMNSRDLRAVRAALADDQRLCIMFNQKDLQTGDVRRLIGDDADVIDMVRFACPPDEIESCIAFASEATDLGVDTAINVMYLSEWFNQPEKLAALKQAGDIVSIVALVDSYGACFPDQVEAATRAVCESLPQTIGFHGHDNTQLAFANALAALKGGAQIIDATVMGMGRGAGNLATELIYTYASTQSSDGSNTPSGQYAALVELLEDMSKLKDQHRWGSNLPYQIAGFAGLKQAQVMEWLSKRRYRTSSIIDSLRNQHGLQLDTTEYPPVSSLRENMIAHTALVIGGGPSVTTHRSALAELSSDASVVAVHSSLKHAPNFAEYNDHIYCLAGHEASGSRSSAIEAMAAQAWVVPTPPRFLDSVPNQQTIYQVASTSSAADTRLGPVSDVAPIHMALGVAGALDCKTIYFCGFDGYTNPTDAELELMRDIASAIEDFKAANPDVTLLSLVPNVYGLEVRSVYAILQGQ